VGSVAESADFRDFVVARSPSLLRVAYVLTRDVDLAQDLLQVALAKAWLAWHRLAEDPEAYVRRILFTTYATWWRRRWRREAPTESLPEPVAHDDFADATSTRFVVAEALAQLPRRQRAVVVLRYFEDLTEADTARVLGCSVGTVKSQCSKALRRLRVDTTLTAAAEGHPERLAMEG
jgi:RNA polymerase sigma-70 factor (sigma-E family)